jgi:hypothetical protein
MNNETMMANIYHLSELFINKFHLYDGAIEIFRKLPLPERFILLATALQPFNKLEHEFCAEMFHALLGHQGDWKNDHLLYHSKYINDLKIFYDKYFIKDDNNGRKISLTFTDRL